jgi:excisionase family DNA binding protein
VTAADLATAADVQALRADIARVRNLLAELREALPPQMISVREASERLGVDPQTVVAMLDRGDLTGRRAGRRRLVDVASMRRAPR